MPPRARPRRSPRPWGRYAAGGLLGRGGMASVYLGRLRGPAGFARPVALKRMHPHLAADAALVAMFFDEARLAARVRHPNVVAPLDLVEHRRRPLLVLDYVRGEALSRLIAAAAGARGRGLPPAVAARVVLDALRGLDAAHEAAGDAGEPLGLVHRDVSPQNLLVGADGNTRVLDFGVAKAVGRLQGSTTGGRLKGKLGYMAPEQLRGATVDRRADVYAAAVVLWEALAGRRLFDGDDAIGRILAGDVAPLPARVPAPLARVVARGLAAHPAHRFPTARAMAAALEAALPPAPPRRVSAWVRAFAGASLARQARLLAELTAIAPAPTPGPRAAPAARPNEAVTVVDAAPAPAAAAVSAPAATATPPGPPPPSSRAASLARRGAAFANFAAAVLWCSLAFMLAYAYANRSPAQRPASALDRALPAAFGAWLLGCGAAALATAVALLRARGAPRKLAALNLALAGAMFALDRSAQRGATAATSAFSWSTAAAFGAAAAAAVVAVRARRADAGAEARR